MASVTARHLAASASRRTLPTEVLLVCMAPRALVPFSTSMESLRVIVKEVYAAGSYQVTSSDSIETQIVAGETADVDFTNDYNDKLIYSTGVVNHFEYDGTGWEWVQN